MSRRKKREELAEEKVQPEIEPPFKYFIAAENDRRYTAIKDSVSSRMNDGKAMTGDFNEDFVRSCEILNITPHPAIIPAPVLEFVPYVPPFDSDSDFDEPESEPKPEPEPEEEEEEEEEIEEVTIHGWKLDIGTAVALSMAVPYARSLTSLRFWNVGADAKTIAVLSDLLEDSSLQKLALDFNPLDEPDELTGEQIKALQEQAAANAKAAEEKKSRRPGSKAGDRPTSRGSKNKKVVEDASPMGVPPSLFTAFVSRSSQIQVLSLRSNHITNRVALELFEALKSNKTLCSLNLWGNYITDDACDAIADIMLTNKTLITLNLGKNNITSIGAIKLAEMAKSKLIEKDELKEMKKLGYGVTSSKGKAFRDPNVTLRYLNLSSNKIDDEGCAVWLSVLDEFAGSGETKEVPAEEESTPQVEKKATGRRSAGGSKKGTAKKEQPAFGRGNSLEHVNLTGNPYSHQDVADMETGEIRVSMLTQLRMNMQDEELGKIRVESVAPEEPEEKDGSMTDRTESTMNPLTARTDASFVDHQVNGGADETTF